MEEVVTWSPGCLKEATNVCRENRIDMVSLGNEPDLHKLLTPQQSKEKNDV
jgi:hypothetical protein